MPTTIKGVTVPDVDGNYNIYINSKLNYEMQQIILKHELTHIEHNHFDSNSPITVLEQIAEYKSKI